MKILRLEVEGFRSLKHVVWEPGDLNVVIGPNGSGKSNLLRLLEMISVSARGRLAKYVQQAGGMEPLVWDGTADQIAIHLLASEEGDSTWRGEFDYEVALARVGRTSGYRVSREVLTGRELDGGLEEQKPFKLLDRQGSEARLFDREGRAVRASPEAVPEEETVLSAAATPFTAGSELRLFHAGVSSWQIYHQINLAEDAPVRQAVVARFEKNVASDGQNLVSVLHTLYSGDRQFKQDIDMAMRAAFGDDYEELLFPPASDQRVQLRIRWRSLKQEQSAASLSDGILRFLFLLTVLSNPSPPALLAIDEPETGLHPSLLPIVAEYSVDAARRSQVIFTTHSAEFLDAFYGVKPTTTVAKWSEGETKLSVVTVEQLKRWLDEYTLGAIYRSGELENIA